MEMLVCVEGFVRASCVDEFSSTLCCASKLNIMKYSSCPNCNKPWCDTEIEFQLCDDCGYKSLDELPDEKLSTKKILGNTLRWIFLLPASLLIMALIYGIVRGIYSIGISRWTNPNSVLSFILIELVANFFAGGSFVFAGYSIASNHKRIVAFCCVGFLLLFSGASLLAITTYTKEYISIVGIITGNIGAISILLYLLKEEREQSYWSQLRE